jgi:hypothetical protein
MISSVVDELSYVQTHDYILCLRSVFYRGGMEYYRNE